MSAGLHPPRADRRGIAAHADRRLRHGWRPPHRIGRWVGNRRQPNGEERTVTDRDIDIERGTVGAGGFPG
ncbi:MAG TPA: hypothetical protein VFQ80_00525, partial [Thermomicrobiales bacterium]|nr:hypothetical protein [Thermomicrobiales bacterium]